MQCMSSNDLRIQLDGLMAERHAAVSAGLGGNGVYMSELEEELEAARAAYVGMAVTEIATFRGELGGRQVG
jgi:hypothetical protein